MRDNIPNSAICNFFYSFYIVYAFLFLVSVVTTFISFFHIKKLGVSGILLGVMGLLVSGISVTGLLFNFLICDRALLGGMSARPSSV